jgi:hypothetical protein
MTVCFPDMSRQHAFKCVTVLDIATVLMRMHVMLAG